MTYDPLLDEFKKLEQSMCEHDDEVVGYVRGTALSICRKCGRGRDAYDAAVCSPAFLPVMRATPPAPLGQGSPA
jgi:hypothetical protein